MITLSRDTKHIDITGPMVQWSNGPMILAYDSDQSDAVGPAELDYERTDEETDAPGRHHHPAGRTEARPGELRHQLDGQHPT